MRKLILKDLILNKRYFLVIGILYIAYMGFFGSRVESPQVYSVFSTFMSCVIPLLVFTREDKFKAVVLSCSLPASRNQIVLARYVLSWILALVMCALMAAAVLAFPGTKLTAAALLSPKPILLALALIAICLAVFIPFLLRFGLTGLLVFLVGVQVLGLVVLVLQARHLLRLDLRAFFAGVKGISLSLGDKLGMPGYYAFLIAAMLVLSLASYALSAFIFRRKDL
jgi:ABC-type transport system involved in multi-copper enzyme maturation permease subunit